MLTQIEIQCHGVHADLRFVKKFTQPDFWAKKFYTLKVYKLRQFLLKKKVLMQLFWETFC